LSEIFNMYVNLQERFQAISQRLNELLQLTCKSKKTCMKHG
jgi:hypothetical protein